MEESIAIVYCTREKTGESNQFIEHLKETCGCNCHVFAIHNPDGVSLSKIYADILNPRTYERISLYLYTMT